MTSTDKPNGLQQSLDQESLLNRMIKQIRRSLDLQEILTTTVTEVRLFLRAERVKVYRFDTSGSGEVIAESIDNERLPSLLGLRFPVHDIPEAARDVFVGGATFDCRCSKPENRVITSTINRNWQTPTN